MKEKRFNKIAKNTLEFSCDDKIDFRLPDNILEILNKQECDILDHIFIQQHSIAEVANILNISKSTVYRRYNNIIKKLKDDKNTR